MIKCIIIALLWLKNIAMNCGEFIVSLNNKNTASVLIVMFVSVLDRCRLAIFHNSITMETKHVEFEGRI